MRARWHGPFQSTLPARGATDVAKGRKRPRKDFNPRSPHGERRRTATHKRRRERFQSTLPARGATEPPARASSRQQFQSTLPARGATPARESKLLDGCISIHAPRTGSDTDTSFSTNEQQMISIHAPRTGSDQHSRWTAPDGKNFNPRSPHGERPDFRRDVFGNQQFQSTLPARGATGHAPVLGCCQRISIHAPRTGSDQIRAGEKAKRPYFNPRSPHGERLAPCRTFRIP